MNCQIHTEQVCEEETINVLGENRTFYVCPICENEKEEVESERNKQLAEQKNRFMCDNMNIPETYHNCSFLNYEVSNEFHKKAIEALTEIKKGLVVICGRNGVGKTHLATALLREHGAGHFEKMFFMSSYLREDSKNQYLNKLLSTPVLVIDEFGRTNTSDYEKNWLGSVLDTRLSNNLLTVIVSNYPLVGMVDKANYTGEYLDGFIGNDILSRLNVAVKIRISGIDYREREKLDFIGI